jgi:putative iron-regulated protein
MDGRRTGRSPHRSSTAVRCLFAEAALRRPVVETSPNYVSPVSETHLEDPVRRRLLIVSVSALVAAFVAAGCGDSDSTAATTSMPVEVARHDVLVTYADVAWSLYNAALDGAESTNGAVDAFLSDPTPASLAAARQAWLDARPAYLHTEAFRFSEGPIDSGDNPEGFINAWPLDESYVDSIIDGTDPITEDSLHGANERGGEKNISTGWHAVEYLLWGRDTSPSGPGDRPFTDFVTTDPSNARRRQYLDVVSGLLVHDLGAVVEAWDPANGSYRQTFLAVDPDEGVRRILTGLGTLSGGELFGQRMTVSFETKDQEEEHSCFSDNTTEDHKGDVEGIRRVYLGLGADDTKLGSSLTDLVASIDPALDADVRQRLDAARDATAAIPRPYDQAILGTDSSPGRQAIRAALAAVDDQTQGLVLVADRLGVKIATDVP